MKLYNFILTFVNFTIIKTLIKYLGKRINRSSYENVFYNYPYKHKTEELFTPDENLFYVYFKETEPSIKQYHLKDISEYYEFKDIIDMQKGYKIKKEDKNYYTFYGFSNAKLRSEAIEILKTRRDVDLDSIKIFYTQGKYDNDSYKEA